MAVVSVIVEIEDGAVEDVLDSLDMIEHASVYAVQGKQAVVVVEGDDLRAVNKIIERFYAIDRVAGVYSVFASEHS